jgi:hypothetical protein
MICNGGYGQNKCHQIAKNIPNYYFNNLGIKSRSITLAIRASSGKALNTYVVISGRQKTLKSVPTKN